MPITVDLDNEPLNFPLFIEMHESTFRSQAFFS